MIAYENTASGQNKPDFLTAYLSSHGWTIQEQGTSQVWTHALPTGENSTVRLSVDSTTSDVAGQIVQALPALVQVEGRPGGSIFNEIMHADADRLYVVLRSEDTADRTLSVDNGVRLLQGMQRLLTAAAWSTFEPGPYLSGKKPSQVTSFLSSLRIGTLETEGYGQAASAPLHDFDEETLTRQVMLTLVRTLTLLAHGALTPAAIADGERRRAWIDQGVSANLCEALVQMFGKPSKPNKKRSKRRVEGRQQMLFDVVWSPLLAASTETPTQIVFDAEIIPDLQDLSEAFRESSPQENFQFQGLVTDLKRSGHSGLGKIVVGNVTREQPDKVTLELEDDLYELAIQAHRSKVPVMCVGTLIKNNKSFELLDPSLAVSETQGAT